MIYIYIFKYLKTSKNYITYIYITQNMTDSKIS